MPTERTTYLLLTPTALGVELSDAEPTTVNLYFCPSFIVLAALSANELLGVTVANRAWLKKNATRR